MEPKLYFLYEIETAFPSAQRWLNENICTIQIEINLITCSCLHNNNFIVG